MDGMVGWDDYVHGLRHDVICLKLFLRHRYGARRSQLWAFLQLLGLVVQAYRPVIVALRKVLFLIKCREVVVYWQLGNLWIDWLVGAEVARYWWYTRIWNSPLRWVTAPGRSTLEVDVTLVVWRLSLSETIRLLSQDRRVFGTLVKSYLLWVISQLLLLLIVELVPCWPLKLDVSVFDSVYWVLVQPLYI